MNSKNKYSFTDLNSSKEAVHLNNLGFRGYNDFLESTKNSISPQESVLAKKIFDKEVKVLLSLYISLIIYTLSILLLEKIFSNGIKYQTDNFLEVLAYFFLIQFSTRVNFKYVCRTGFIIIFFCILIYKSNIFIDINNSYFDIDYLPILFIFCLIVIYIYGWVFDYIIKINSPRFKSKHYLLLFTT